MLVHTCNSSTQEAEAGQSLQVQSQPRHKVSSRPAQLHSETVCQKDQNKTKQSRKWLEKV